MRQTTFPASEACVVQSDRALSRIPAVLLSVYLELKAYVHAGTGTQVLGILIHNTKKLETQMSINR